MAAKKIREMEDRAVLLDTDLTVIDTIDGGTFKTSVLNLLAHSHQHDLNELAVSGTPSVSSYLRGDGTWASLDFGSYVTSSALTTGLAGKADTSHNHTASNISDLSTAAQVITAPWTFNTPAFAISDLGSVSGSVAVNLANGCFFSATITGATTLSITGTLTGTSAKNLGIYLTNAGANITWPASVKWPGGLAPTLTGAGVDILTFISLNNGTTWINIGQVLDAK